MGSVEVIWKLYAYIMNNMIFPSITLHDALCRVRHRRDMSTTILEENIDQHLAGLCHEAVFQIFLEMCNSYKSLDRGRCMEILR